MRFCAAAAAPPGARPLLYVRLVAVGQAFGERRGLGAMIGPSPGAMRTMPIKAILYSADAPDQEPDLVAIRVGELNARQLLWIDLASPTEAEVLAVAKQFD